jgi:hypothetical protein
MGAEGSDAGVREGLVLDAGGLIAFERAEKWVVAFIEQALDLGEEVIVPASALAQAWRGGSRSARLARLIASAESDPLDEARAKEVGERLASRDKADVADAHVVCCALDRDAALVTSDPADIQALADPAEQLTVVSV